MSSIRAARSFVVAAFALVAVAAGGCENLWHWTADSDSFDGLMAAGRNAMESQKYELARTKFEAAVELQPRHSEARYYLAKSAVLASGADPITIVQTLTEDEAEDRGSTTLFHFPIELANGIYQSSEVVLGALRPIYDGQARIGLFNDADVDLDLAIAYSLRGILRLRDTNGDGVIDVNDLDPDLYGLIDDPEFLLEGIDNLDPDELNDMLDDLQDLLDQGGDLIEDELIEEDLVDVEDLEEEIQDLSDDLTIYYVNTGVPGNPGEGDNDGDGTVDEECLNNIDDDADGRTDEDARVAGCP